MANNVAYRGQQFTIVYAIRNDDSIPAQDFFEALDRQWQARFLTLYTRLGDTGRISNPEHFSKFGNDFWEFKAFRYRMPCYHCEGRLVVITHGFTKKKEGRAPEQEIDRAERIQNEYEEKLVLQTQTGGRNDATAFHFRAIYRDPRKSTNLRTGTPLGRGDGIDF